MKRSFVASAAICAVAGLVLSGCGSSGNNGEAANGDITLTFLGADYGTGPADSSTAYWQKVAADFHKTNPKITVKVSTINWNDYDTKVKTQLQNKDYPDILQGEFFPQYATDHLLAPLSDVMTNPDAGLAVFKDGFSVGGVQYGIPFDTSARALFYNKLAFTDAGIANPPATWDELKTDAGKLKAKGYIGYALPLGPEEAQAESYLWMLGNGGGWQNSSGKYAINSAENIETFQFLKGMVDAGDTEPNPATYDRTADSATAFAQGKVGMESNGPFLTATIAAAGKLTTSDYAAVPMPGKTGPLTQTLGVADALQVFKGSATKLAAVKKFLDFALNDDNQLAWAKKYALLPGTQSAAAKLENDPILGAFVKALPNTVLYPSDSNWTATVLPAIKKSIGTAVTGDPSKVLGQLQDLATSGS
jgi:multiple sugar transport system substrate-binding protein